MSMAQRLPYREPYKSPFEWPRTVRGRTPKHEFPAHHLRRARVDCTYHSGHTIESVHISAPSQVELAPIRQALYDRLNRMHGSKGIYIFYNNMSVDSTKTESAEKEAA
jgi:hypothetical protein